MKWYMKKNWKTVDLKIAWIISDAKKEDITTDYIINWKTFTIVWIAVYAVIWKMLAESILI